MNADSKAAGGTDTVYPGTGNGSAGTAPGDTDFATWDWNIETGETTYNEHWARILGDDPHQIQWHFDAWKERIHPEDLPAVLDAANSHLRGLRPLFQAEYRMRHRGGHWIWLQAHGRVYERNSEGTPLRVAGIHTDITARKNAEEALRLSREMYKHTVELTTQIPWVTDADGVNIYCDPAWEAYTGLSLKTALNDRWVDAFHPEDRARTIAQWNHSIVTGQRYTVCHRLRRKDGEYRFCESRSQPHRNEAGEVLRWYGTTEDIHERTVAEQSLRASEARRALALEGAHLGTWDWNLRSGEVIRDATWFELLGLEPDDNRDLNFWRNRVHPEDLQEIDRLWEVHFKDQTRPFRAEFRIRHRSGEWRGMVSHGRIVERDAMGPIRACGINQDVTERRRFEDELTSSERFSRLLLESHRDCVALLDGSGCMLYMNPAGLKRMGVEKPDAVLGWSWINLWAEEQREQIRENARLACAGQVAEFQSRCRPDSALPGWWDVLLSPVAPVSDGPARILAVAREITHIREQEERRQEAIERERLQTILENLNEGIVIAEPDGRIRFMNRAAVLMYGLDTAAPEGLRCEDMFEAVEAIDFPGQEDSSSDRLLARAARGEAFSDIETRLRNRRNGRLWIASCGSTPVRSASGELILAVLSLRDVTGGRRAAGEIQAANTILHNLSGQLLRLQDEEHRRIARELHDGTVQTLSAALMNLSVLSESPALRELRYERTLVSRTQDFMNQSVKELRTLSYLLHPSVLDELGLVPAVRSWLDGFTERTGIPVDISMPSPMSRLSPEVETALFRIIQEALGNIHRHAHASNASVRLEIENCTINLEITDDGRGFDPARANRKAGVGLPGMRERAVQLGGSLAVASQPGKTVIRVVLHRGTDDA